MNKDEMISEIEEPLLCDLCDSEDADWVDEDYVFKVCPDCDAYNAGEWVPIL
jgi:hypothetical protein